MQYFFSHLLTPLRQIICLSFVCSKRKTKKKKKKKHYLKIFLKIPSLCRMNWCLHSQHSNSMLYKSRCRFLTSHILNSQWFILGKHFWGQKLNKISKIVHRKQKEKLLLNELLCLELNLLFSHLKQTIKGLYSNCSVSFTA